MKILGAGAIAPAIAYAPFLVLDAFPFLLAPMIVIGLTIPVWKAVQRQILKERLHDIQRQERMRM